MLVSYRSFVHFENIYLSIVFIVLLFERFPREYDILRAFAVSRAFGSVRVIFTGKIVGGMFGAT